MPEKDVPITEEHDISSAVKYFGMLPTNPQHVENMEKVLIEMRRLLVAQQQRISALEKKLSKRSLPERDGP